ncbi:hypothetical protein OS190_14400 [Sulfitobacter sp. F26204]|uniref:hypothetical protein n=1 Tax=Sulfitobacter sp. F26204 TaxID=2996014 RepID=UPI00225E0A63|nr:hypothetical protein [Sulfitobacter sp. F26204]MCX7560764.1 hypothetical protein [Sulfitobacter sp. F26204]
MAALITDATGSIAYWEGSPHSLGGKAFDLQGRFRKPDVTSFARVSLFADNSNHAPSGYDISDCWDASIDLLFRIAGAR